MTVGMRNFLCFSWYNKITDIIPQCPAICVKLIIVQICCHSENKTSEKYVCPLTISQIGGILLESFVHLKK